MCFLGSIAAGDEGGRDLARVVAQFQRILRHGDRVQIDDAIEAIVVLLQFDKLHDGAEIVAKMQIAGGCTPEKTRSEKLDMGCAG